MANKKIIILGVLVAGIWGTIGVRVFKSIYPEEDVMPAVPRRLVSDTATVVEYVLDLSYDDPFLKRKAQPLKSIAPAKTTPAKIIAPKPATPSVIVNWDKFRYFGIFYNASRDNRTAVIRLGNNDHFVGEGETLEGFLVTEIGADSVKISYGENFKYIKKEK